MSSRPSWDTYFASLAQLAATRSTCVRRKVGCVIVRENRVLTTGYNGALPGEAHCTEVGCYMEKGHCVRTNHAEANAVSEAARRGVSLEGSVAYVTLQPCWTCLKLLLAAGISTVWYIKPYPVVGNQLYDKYVGTNVLKQLQLHEPEPTPVAVLI